MPHCVDTPIRERGIWEDLAHYLDEYRRAIVWSNKIGLIQPFFKTLQTSQMYETFECDVFHYSYLLCCTSKTANDRKIFKLAIVLQFLISRKISKYQAMYAPYYGRHRPQEENRCLHKARWSTLVSFHLSRQTFMLVLRVMFSMPVDKDMIWGRMMITWNEMSSARRTVIWIVLCYLESDVAALAAEERISGMHDYDETRKL
jgi:hypothetical protein